MPARDPRVEVAPLPKPPAPTARDANPWPLPGQSHQATAAPGVRRGLRRARDARPAGALRGAVAVGIAVTVIAIALIQARTNGRPGEVAGAAFAAFLMVMFVVARLRRGRRRARRDTDEREGDGRPG